MLETLRRFHGRVNEFFNIDLKLLEWKLKNPKGVFFVNTPEHQNVGDSLLAFATEKLLNDIDVEFLEITDKELEFLRFSGRMKLLNRRLVCLMGGGNLGSLYYYLNAANIDVIKECDKSRVLMFPNTSYFNNTEDGRRIYEETKETYNSRENILIFLRERVSYDMIKTEFNNIALCPDMSLYLNESENPLKRSGCLLVLRRDDERTMTDDESAYLKDEFSKIFNGNVRLSDTFIDKKILKCLREYEVNKKIDEFKRAELVVTDRLHGMLISAITGTPCIAVESLSHKIRGCYEWVKDLPYIRLAPSVSEVVPIYNKMEKGEFKYSGDRFKSYFDNLKKTILEYAENQ